MHVYVENESYRCTYTNIQANIIIIYSVYTYIYIYEKKQDLDQNKDIKTSYQSFSGLEWLK